MLGPPIKDFGEPNAEVGSCLSLLGTPIKKIG
jgi:hypothetical protein